MPAVVHAVFSKGAFPDYKRLTTEDPVMIADFVGGPDRTFILADGPKMIGTPVMPYILLRDKGKGASLFAKVLRVADDAASDPIASVAAAALTPAKGGKASPLAGAWRVTWKDGRKDVWLVNNAFGNPWRISAEGLPAIDTDAQVAFIRFDKENKPTVVRASAASFLNMQNGPELAGTPRLQGRVGKVDLDAKQATFRISWKKGQEAMGDIPAGAALVTVPRSGQPSTWQVDRVTEQETVCVDVKPTMALTEFVAVKGKPGWYAMQSGVGRFFAAGGQPLPAYAVGKAIYRDGRMAGRIAELDAKATSALIVSLGKPARLGGPLHGPHPGTRRGRHRPAAPHAHMERAIAAQRRHPPPPTAPRVRGRLRLGRNRANLRKRALTLRVRSGTVLSCAARGGPRGQHTVRARRKA